ncbi:sec-independent protein translocase protein TatB [Xenorhabdus cabanillasii]|uniref:Sec-independent protein translocase protein TatB n=1 Tax=Xenorhabdus cabanillasii TaxID=351673 RepID=A0A3D9UC83_9GAMM|nr:Sec-independent protein translocase protein TatB [Xenorhabdus cabanillasii]REF27092.1 sec-independent protein translocase protein TatB [Xenorhabdus cabanillasii]
MFDIGFSELLLVLVIGLIVLGPERLPVAVKTIAGWVRVLRSLAVNVQSELAKELKLQELQDSLKKMEAKADLQSLSPELKASMDELREAAESLKKSYQLTPEEAKELEEDETHFHSLESDPVPEQKLNQYREQVTEKKLEEISKKSTKQNTKQSPEKSNSEH